MSNSTSHFAMSDDSENEDLDECIKTTDMSESMVAVFMSFMAKKEYEEALNFIDMCFNVIPTPVVMKEIIFQIMMSCENPLLYRAEEYLERVLCIMPPHDNLTCHIMEALGDNSKGFLDVWSVFSHLVLSSLYHLKIPEAYGSHEVFIKSPNCDILVDVFVKAFLKCPVKSSTIGFHTERKLQSLLKWINLYYKYNIQMETVLENLHNLLDHIVDSEKFSDPSLPSFVIIHTASLSKYITLALNICKDVFACPENQQRFFNNSMSPYMITKVCQFRLHHLMEKSSLYVNLGMLTLESIVDCYFFHQTKSKAERIPDDTSNQNISGLQKKSDSARKKNRRKKLKKFSKDRIPGDQDFHVCCRLGKPADLLSALYGDKSKDINLKNDAGNTPLHEACLSASYICCKFLIEEAGDRQVDYTATDNDGRTPLHCAAHVNDFDIVKLLLNRGGNHLVLCLDHDGCKPIDYSTTNEMKDLLQSFESRLEKAAQIQPPGSSDAAQLELPRLKAPEELHLYLLILRSLITNYCELYNLDKDDAGVETLSHDKKECYHYKADSGTLCTADTSTLETFGKTVHKFVTFAEGVAKEERAKKQILHWKIFASTLDK